MRKFLFFTVIFIFISSSIFAQDRRSDRILQTDHFGITAMAYYNYANWVSGKNKASLKFDSFRVWAQTDLSSTIFASVQYRFYEGWRTPTNLFIGWNINKNNTLRIGQTWVPFGFTYQPFDDWGNITYYVGLQDDYDMGISWEGNFNIFQIHAAFFKNQQLSSSSSQRIDTDIFTGEAGPDNLFAYTKRNKELNQFNVRFQVAPTWNNGGLVAGVSGMFGQLYNKDTDLYGTRFAAAFHFALDIKNFHFNFQETWYNFTQKLPDTATVAMNDFLNVASWNFGYEIPTESNIVTLGADYDIIGDKLSAYANYSYLSGGTSQTNSQLFTAGVSTIWRLFQIYGEVHYGINDPQLSGNASGYGIDAGSYDLGFQIRFYYTMSILNEKTIGKIKKKLQEKKDKAMDKEDTE
jgi:hypothetical protein